MRRFFTFLGIGSFFSTVEEFLTVVVLKHDVASYIFTVVVLFPVFLTFVYFTSPLADRVFKSESSRELARFVGCGFVGLMIEWFAVGLSPWSNPDASVVGMLIFQLGMFSFWATVGFAPRLFVSASSESKATRRSIMKFYLPYFAVVYLTIGLIPERLKFGVIICLILFGYLFLNIYFYRYFAMLKRRGSDQTLNAAGEVKTL